MKFLATLFATGALALSAVSIAAPAGASAGVSGGGPYAYDDGYGYGGYDYGAYGYGAYEPPGYAYGY